MQSGKERKYRRRCRVLRLPFPTRTDHYQHHGRHPQAVSSQGGIPNYVREAFEEGKTELGGRGLRLADLMAMLRTVIVSLPQVFICVDAVDEFLPKCLPELLESLRDIIHDSPTTRIFLTGRPHIMEDIQRYFTRVVVIPISPNPDDVRNYVKRRLDRDTEPEAMTSDLRADIVRVILEKISDTYVRPFSISTLSMMHTY